MPVEHRGDYKEKSCVSEGYIFKLWELRSRLNFHFKQAMGSEKELILRRIGEVDRNLEDCLGKKPRDAKDIKNLLAMKNPFPSVRGV